ncbi:MAG: hypothetical protein QM762_18515 [Chryseolinea sp.]
MNLDLFPKMLFVIFLACLITIPCLAQVPRDSVWIQAPNGCKVYNPHPVKSETITWSGECSGGYAIGKGTLQWFKAGKPNQQYDGEMKRGMPHGSGRYVYEDGSVREGMYVNGDLSGKGKIIRKYKSNVVSYTYIGDMLEDFPSGKGTEIEFSEKGDTARVYTGEFADGVIKGEGVMKTRYGNFAKVQKGKFKQGLLIGNGEISEYYKGKRIEYYNGEFVNYARNGNGESASGVTRYLGEWRDNKREGKGKSYLDSMLVYDGEWVDDKYHGAGKRIYIDGSSYYGQFRENRRHGIGKQRWKDGAMYIGEFANDVYSGYGFIVKGGKLFACGNWLNGRLHTEVDFKRMKEVLLARHKNDLAQFGINLQ